MAVNFIMNGAEDNRATIMLAHGAGAPMDSGSMNAIAGVLDSVGCRVVRFEFAYMAGRREGHRRPPPRAESLMAEYLTAVELLGAKGPLIIGGKSMGGRVASMIADGLHSTRHIVGLLCLGYPFHPIGKPDQLRTRHLDQLMTPTLICQGTRDPMGTRDEVSGYLLSKKIEMIWLEDGDHDLKPRKSVSGLTAADHLRTIANEVSIWTHQIA